MKLRTKLGLTAVSLVITVILLVAVVLFIFERQTLIKEKQESRIRDAESLSEIAKESIIISDELVLLNYIKLIKKKPEISYAMFISSLGIVYAHTNFEQMGVEINDEVWNKIYNTNSVAINSWENQNKKVLDISVPVRIQNNIVGYVRLGLLQEVIDKDVLVALNKTRDRILIVAAIALILGLVGSFILAQTMTNPIKKLAQGAAKIGEGKLDTVINVKSKDELGELAKDFNLMAQKLKELDRMKEDFMSSVTHELRSPLTAIKGYINLMLEGRAGEISPRQKEFLTIVSNNTSRLGRFINDILDLAKIEAGMMEIKPELVSLYEPANEIMTLMKSVAEDKKITLISEVPPDAPKLMIDKDRVGQIITNLLSNALKFTPEGGKITLKYIDKGEYVQIGVADTGIGIPKESLGKIFSKFEQVSEHRKKVKGAKGTGLGLSIAKGLTEGHGGKIWVESEVDVGTTFWFTLPKQYVPKDGVRI